MDRFLVRMWDSKYKKMWTFENDGFLECIFECLKQQLAYESDLKVLEKLSFNHIADGRVFMQCTGLKDKNGKLIYEGDILKSNDTIFKVFWWSECGSFAFEKEKSVYTTSQQSITLCGFEIIGNIHENKDLLEEK